MWASPYETVWTWEDHLLKKRDSVQSLFIEGLNDLLHGLVVMTFHPGTWTDAAGAGVCYLFHIRRLNPSLITCNSNGQRSDYSSLICLTFCPSLYILQLTNNTENVFTTEMTKKQLCARARLHQSVSGQHCDNFVMTLVILFSLKTRKSLENGWQPQSGATPLFAMRIASLGHRRVVAELMLIPGANGPLSNTLLS